MNYLSKKPKLLDLFCCEGGAGTGYSMAGFEITGVDIKYQKNNPHNLIVSDAIEYALKYSKQYDAIHASPPCQSYSKALKHLAKPQPKLISLVRDILENSGKPYIIENVPGAPLLKSSDLFGGHGVELCGSMFGLKIRRHRIFETNFQLPNMFCNHNRVYMNPHNSTGRRRMRENNCNTTIGLETIFAHEMGITWMSKHGAREAVPPCYTEWIGKQLLKYI